MEEQKPEDKQACKNADSTQEATDSKAQQVKTDKDAGACDCQMMPEVSFSTLVLSLASAALVQLGEVPNPETQTTDMNILMAKHSIDLLAMLKQKTYNNLDANEQRLMDDILYDLRMKYVVLSKK